MRVGAEARSRAFMLDDGATSAVEGASDYHHWRRELGHQASWASTPPKTPAVVHDYKVRVTDSFLSPSEGSESRTLGYYGTYGENGLFGAAVRRVDDTAVRMRPHHRTGDWSKQVLGQGSPRRLADPASQKAVSPRRAP